MVKIGLHRKCSNHIDGDIFILLRKGRYCLINDVLVHEASWPT